MALVFGSGMFFLMYGDSPNFVYSARSAAKKFTSHLQVDQTIRIWHCFQTCAILLFQVLQFVQFLYDSVCLDIFRDGVYLLLILAVCHRFRFCVWNCGAPRKMTACATVLDVFLSERSNLYICGTFCSKYRFWAAWAPARFSKPMLPEAAWSPHREAWPTSCRN